MTGSGRARLAALAGAAALAAYAAVWNPGRHWPIRCPFHALTGLDCPGCGSTRALHALLQGRLAAAAGHNALTMLALIPLAVVWLRWLLPARWTERLPDLQRLHVATARPLLYVVIAFTVARNLPLPVLRGLRA